MSSILNMLAAVTGQNPNMPLPQAQAQAQDDQDQDIVVDAWAPTKRNWLGKLADGILRASGEKPIYEGRMQERDMKEAMQGFTQDPLETIRRIAKFNPQMALELKEKYDDNTRQQGNLDRQNKLFDFKVEEAIADRVANAMGRATPETWGAMREQMLNYAKRRGVELPYGIPEAYDQNAIDFIRYGEIPVVKQEGFKRADQRIAQRGRSLDQADTRISETIRHNQVQEGQAATNERGRNQRTAITEGGRNQRAQAKTNPPRFIGKPQFSPDKKKVRLQTKEGYEIYDISRGTDHARLLKKVKEED
jgi:hypothetical protein